MGVTLSKLPPAPPQVYAAIAAVSAELAQAGIRKDRKNAQQGYNFRGIDDVYNALAPILAKHALVILPRVISRAQTERATNKGGVLFSVVVEMEFDFVSATDGSTHTTKAFGEAMDSADKATNKAMSAAYKYTAFQTFCIPTEGDHDADATTPDVAPTVPAGFEAWWEQMNDTAGGGLAALKAAWVAADPTLRAYVAAQKKDAWEALKASAAKVAA